MLKQAALFRGLLEMVAAHLTTSDK